MGAAEQLAFHERRRQGRAVHLHHHAGFTGAECVDRRGQELLPGARFPQEQDGRIGCGDLLDQVQDPFDGRTFPDDIVSILEANIALHIEMLRLQTVLQPCALGHGLPQLALCAGAGGPWERQASPRGTARRTKRASSESAASGAGAQASGTRRRGGPYRETRSSTRAWSSSSRVLTYPHCSCNRAPNSQHGASPLFLFRLPPVRRQGPA